MIYKPLPSSRVITALPILITTLFESFNWVRSKKAGLLLFSSDLFIKTKPWQRILFFSTFLVVKIGVFWKMLTLFNSNSSRSVHQDRTLMLFQVKKFMNRRFSAIVLVLLKVSKFGKQIMVPKLLPKNKPSSLSWKITTSRLIQKRVYLLAKRA